ncbi:MAG TPA: AMP-binding protein [Bryobacteraceae bacterium]|nr:AMP-binding protein [Bryobacteraceae bacterium]
MVRPFDSSSIARGEDGIARYQNRPASLIEMLRLTVDRTPLNEAVVELGGDRINYHEVWDRAARVAGGLKAQGIARGDRVAIRLGNCLDWCVAFWGTLMSGAIVVPVNTRFSEAEVEYVITDSGSRFVFLPGQPLPDGHPFVVEDLTQPDVAAIFYTSGTTGFPKGAMTTHEGFLANCETCRRIVPLPTDGSVRTLVSVPLFHVTGCNSQLLTSCEWGGGSVIMRAFEVQAFLRAIVEERITSVTSVPAIFWLAISQSNFREFDTKRVRWAMYGGAPIAPDLVGRIMEAFPNARVGNGFGLTETSSVATFLPHEYSRVRPDTVGFAAPVVDLDLFETDSSGVGELLVRGPNVVKGYWNKPEATAQTFVNGWLHTGDLARIDPDGFVQIVDRKKDMVNRGGENVYCVEVENALCAHPAVYECAVMGVPDTMMGEKVGAVVVLKPGAKAEPAAICEFLKGRLADFKIPQFMAIRPDPLPRNPGGKILKPRLRNETAWGQPLR